MQVSPAVELDPMSWLSCESPCDTCPLIAQCRDQQQACEQFKSFYERGGEKWKAEPRVPSMAIYRKVFKVEKPMKVPKARRRRRLAALDAREQRLSLFMLKD
jgi:hypothetical protein